MSEIIPKDMERRKPSIGSVLSSEGNGSESEKEEEQEDVAGDANDTSDDGSSTLNPRVIQGPQFFNSLLRIGCKYKGQWWTSEIMTRLLFASRPEEDEASQKRQWCKCCSSRRWPFVQKGI